MPTQGSAKEDSPIKVKAVLLKSRKTYTLRWKDRNGDDRQAASKVPAVDTPWHRRRADLAALAKAKQLEKTWDDPDAMPWDEFVRIYHGKKMRHLDPDSQAQWRVARNHIDRILKIKYLHDLTDDALERMVDKWQANDLSIETIRSYLRVIGVAMNWAAHKKRRYIKEVPTYELPGRHQEIDSGVRGRAIVQEELDRMITAVEKVRPTDATVWKRFIEGLFLSGLRLSEGLALSWEWDGKFSVVLDGRNSHFRIMRDKSRKDRLLPVAPEFVRFLEKHWPEKRRRGSVFGINYTMQYTSAVISDIGQAANVKVDVSGKTASAQDLRKSFGTRWSERVMPAVLKDLMRHSDIKTTMKYYVNIQVQTISNHIWDVEEARVQNRVQSAKRPGRIELPNSGTEGTPTPSDTPLELPRYDSNVE